MELSKRTPLHPPGGGGGRDRTGAAASGSRIEWTLFMGVTKRELSEGRVVTCAHGD